MSPSQRRTTLVWTVSLSIFVSAGCGGQDRAQFPPAPLSPEQIARWTPAPFEPLELLAIREWETTSFTSRLAPTADGKHYLIAGTRVLLWSITRNQPEHEFLGLDAEDDERVVAAMEVAPDGAWFVTGDSQGTVRIWNLETRQPIAARQVLDNDIVDLAIAPDAREIAAISFDNIVTTFDSATLEAKNRFQVDTNSLKRIAYMAPGKLAVAGESTSLWETTTGKLVRQLSPGRYSYALARSPDDATFLFGGADSLHLWNIVQSKQESEMRHGVSGSEIVAFSPDGKFLATTNGKNVELWNLAERRLVQVIDGFGWAIVDLGWFPETHLLAVASEMGVTRLWGTPAQGAAVGLNTLHRPVPPPVPSAKFPATPSQSEQVIDLRTIPRIPNSVPNSLARDHFSCEAEIGPDEVRAFYRHFLEASGWKLVETPSWNPDAIEFRKDGFMLSVSCQDAGNGKTTVTVQSTSNYDIRWTPKFDASPIEPKYEFVSTLAYDTKAELFQIETNLLRRLHAAGWTAYSRLKSSYSETPNQRTLEFLQNGTTLRVSIGRFPTSPASYTVQYSLFPNNSSTPVPPDSGFVEFDGSTDPQLVAVTKMSLAETRKYYDEQMTALGWLVHNQGTGIKKDQAWLTYIRGQRNVTIGLMKLPNQSTLVRVGDAAGSLWDAANPKEESTEATSVVGLEAADLPVLNATNSARFDPIGKTIEVQLDSTTLAAAAEQYIEALQSIGWSAQEGGIRDEEYTMIDFAKDEHEFTFRAHLKEGKAVVSFAGDGLLWNKELPGNKVVTSYETWLRVNKLPPGLDLLDRYESAMRAIAPSATQQEP